MKVVSVAKFACWIFVIICFSSLNQQSPMGAEFHIQYAGVPSEVTQVNSTAGISSYTSSLVIKSYRLTQPLIPSPDGSSSPECAQSLSRVWLFVTPWRIAPQALLFVGFSSQEYWSGLPFPPPGDLPNPGIKPRSPTLQVDSLSTEPPGKPDGSTHCVPNTEPWSLSCCC